jgi:putative ABC transport system permease protein
VGSTPAYLEHYGAELKEGKMWENSFDAVLGYQVASERQMKLGDQFYSSHGLDEAGEVHGDHAFTVVGSLQKCDCVLDRLVLTSMESIWDVHDHGDSDEPVSRDYTAVLLKKRNAMAILAIPQMLIDSKMQVALPSIEINRLNQNFGIGMDTVRAIAIVIMLLSFVSVFISLYNSLKERKYELALMRSMGGSRSTLFRLIIQEGVLLTLIGFVLGIVLSRFGLYLLSELLQDEFNYSLNGITLLPGELVLFLVSLLVGILASLLPAIKAVRMDISKTLGDD